MFWYAVIHVLNKLGFFRPYLRVCETLIDLLVWEAEKTRSKYVLLEPG